MNMRSVSIRYAELHAYSCFCFHRGASTVESMVEAGRAVGLSALAITDRDGLYGSVRQWLHTRRLLEEQDAPKPRNSLSSGHLDPPDANWRTDWAAPGATPPVVGLDRHADRAVGMKIEEAERLEAHRQATLAGGGDGPVPQPVYGAELGLADGSRVVALARNRAGWRNLSALITESRLAGSKGVAVLPFERLVARKEGLFVLSGGLFGPIDRILLGLDGRRSWRRWKPVGPWGRPLGSWLTDSPVAAAVAAAQHAQPRREARRDDPGARYAAALHEAGRWRDAFGHDFFLEVSDHRLPEEQWVGSLLARIGEDLSIPRVATNLAHYGLPADRPLQDVVSCIRLKTTLQKANTALLPNGHFHLKGPAAMAQLFRQDLDAVALSAELADDCRFDLKDLPYSFPVYPVPKGHTLQTRLEELTWEGAADRYGERLDTDPRIAAQIQHELDVVGRMGLAGYFLIVWDIAHECRRRGILCQGRGSAANSCVCYCLAITAVDPIALDLLFERFLSEARGGFPDIDIDISNSKREEILQFVYDKYGRDHCAMVANVITYHPRSAIRDVGKAFGLGLDQVDRMAKNLTAFATTGSLQDVFGAGGEEAITEDANTLQQTLLYTERLCGFPRHIGIHSGGVVISGTPLGEACPLENASMEDRSVLQWDKDDVAHTGLVKIDLLALGMLSVVQEASRLLSLEGRVFEMAQLQGDDPAIYDLICEADTVGLFQIESRAQMNTLPRLRPRSFHDLVVEVALIRPGPIQGDMVHPYLRRRAGREPITYAHPSLEPILARTLGIPLFQEQAMKMAIATAGFSPGEADRLRKVMGFKRATDEMEQLFGKMVAGMQENGIDLATAEKIRSQLRGFAAYGFPESHAASFALIVYASAWLKVFEAPAFFAGLLNCQPMGFYSAATLTADARRHGVVLHPVCVNRSDWRWTLEGERGMRAGVLQVHGLGEDDGEIIEEARRLGGPFRGVHDFCERVELPRAKLQTLAEAGAMECFGVDRRQALWEVAGWRKRLPLEGPARQGVLPGFKPLSEAEQNLMDHAVAGFTAQAHPMTYVRDQLADLGYVGSLDLRRGADGSIGRTAGLVITRQRPGTAKGTFFITLEDEQGFANIIVHKRLFDEHRRLLRRVKFLGVWGRLQVREHVVNLIADGFEDLAKRNLLGVADEAEQIERMRSRDFH